MRRRTRWALVVGAGIVVVAATAFSVFRKDLARTRRTLATLEEVSNVLGAELLMELPGKLRESSGVAVSVRNDGLFWTHNDSGDDAVLYALRPEDGFVGEVRLTGAEAEDWEDIATGPCIRDASAPCVYIGDIGTNTRRRSRLGLLVLEEPRIDEAGALPTEVPWTALALSYQGGPRNAEALAVSQGGDLLIVDRHGTVFRALRRELEAGVEGGLVVLRPNGTLPLPPEPPGNYRGAVSAATMRGAVLVVRTYSGVFFFERAEPDWRTVRQPCWVGHLGPAGEGLDVAPPDILYLTRERKFGFDRPAALHKVACAP